MQVCVKSRLTVLEMPCNISISTSIRGGIYKAEFQQLEASKFGATGAWSCPSVIRKAFAFWYTKSGSAGLPRHAFQGLLSAVQIGDLEAMTDGVGMFHLLPRKLFFIGFHKERKYDCNIKDSFAPAFLLHHRPCSMSRRQT